MLASASAPSQFRSASLAIAAGLVAVTPIWSTAAYSASLLLLLVTWLLNAPWRRQGWRPPALLGAAVFVACVFVATIAAPDQSAAWEELSSYYPFLLLLLVGDAVRDERDLRWIGLCFLASCGIAAAMATAQGLGLVSWEGQETRFNGTVGIFEYAASMVIAWGVSAWMFLQVRGRWAALGLFVLSLLFLDAIRLNATRASLIALLAVIVIIVLCGWRARTKILLLLLPFAAGVPVVMGSELGSRMLKADKEFSLDDPRSQRQVIWEYAWTQFRDAPWLGSGPGAFAANNGKLKHDPRLAELPRLKHPYKTAHSIPLHLLATSGLIGFAGFMAWFVLTISQFIRAARRSARVAAPALFVFAAVLAFGITDMSLLNTRISGLLCLALGLGVSALRAESAAAASSAARVAPS